MDPVELNCFRRNLHFELNGGKTTATYININNWPLWTTLTFKEDYAPVKHLHVMLHFHLFRFLHPDYIVLLLKKLTYFL